MSKYIGNFVQSDFAQGFGKMGIQTIIDSFDLISPGFSSTFDQFGGTDYLGIRPTDNQKAGYYTAMALTFLTPGGAEAGAEKLAVKGLTNLELVQKAATFAERAIGGTGRFAGTAKHNYATNLLERYQSIYGNKGLQFKVPFNNGPGNRGFLDVLDNTNGIIYDWKFGYPGMTPAQLNMTPQMLKYKRNFRLTTQVIKP
ncbi:hypothetical protein [Flavobacterium piscis]|uniref:Uncharacterized protein n=1 Tax=Flavobacterium piscis TaxID=1114874 RepID=A0ABU1YER4_9FLAO|nr:hypothetical protein [Flavobacterium piscis]MDR7212729.1 hypothetical protein [Flavobacterium piscis]